MTDNGTFIINGTERVVVSPAAPLARASSSITTRARRTRRASCSTARASSRTAARGSTSSSTPRTSSTSASTAAASCTRRCCCARSATRPRSCSTTSTTPRRSSSSRARSTRSRSSTSCSPASARRATSSTRRRSEVLVKKNRKFTKRGDQEAARTSNVDRLPIELDELVGKVARQGRHRRGRPARSSSQCNEEVTEAKLDELRERGIERVQGALHRQPQRRPVPARHADRRQARRRPDEAIMEIYRRLRPGDPPTLETAQTLFHNLFFNPERYDLSQGRPPQAELQVQDRRAARQHRSSPSATSSRRSAT